MPPVQIQSTVSAFAAILGDGSVQCWGRPTHGGYTANAQERLRDVRQIHSTLQAFAAICGDGSVVTWGNAGFGGDSNVVQDALTNVVQIQHELQNVEQIQATVSAFAAIRQDGSVVTWGDDEAGGDSSLVQAQLRTVQCIQATEAAFAAIKKDGSVVTWGLDDSGGDSSSVQAQLWKVKHIQACGVGFAAILENGTVVCWGAEDILGITPTSQLVNVQSIGSQVNVQSIQASQLAFAAILDNGQVVTWGDRGGSSSRVQHQLQNVKEIHATDHLFAALLENGSVVTWNYNSPKPLPQLRNVLQIQAGRHSFAALKSDGSVVTWGHAHGDDDFADVQEQLKNVLCIQASYYGFAAVRAVLQRLRHPTARHPPLAADREGIADRCSTGHDIPPPGIDQLLPCCGGGWRGFALAWQPAVEDSYAQCAVHVSIMRGSKQEEAAIRLQGDPGKSRGHNLQKDRKVQKGSLCKDLTELHKRPVVRMILSSCGPASALDTIRTKKKGDVARRAEKKDWHPLCDCAGLHSNVKVQAQQHPLTVPMNYGTAECEASSQNAADHDVVKKFARQKDMLMNLTVQLTQSRYRKCSFRSGDSAPGRESYDSFVATPITESMDIQESVFAVGSGPEFMIEGEPVSRAAMGIEHIFESRITELLIIGCDGIASSRMSPGEAISELPIFLNLVLLGAEVDASSGLPLDVQLESFYVLNNILVSIFVVEVVLKISAYRSLRHKDLQNITRERASRCFGHLGLASGLLKSEADQMTGHLRVMRFARLVRALRGIRVIRLLRCLAFTISKSAGYISGLRTILFSIATWLQRAQPREFDLADFGFVLMQDVEFRLLSFLSERHSVGESMLTLFLSITGGVFCNMAIESARADKDMAILQQMRKHEAQVDSLRELFKEIDNDGSSVLTLPELKDNMANFMQSLEISTQEDVPTLCKNRSLLRTVIDADNSGEITLDEFVFG
ncbi:putative E3 ubiquitin-protein ligase HERC1 [Symbiodinium microadriaticum]|uniref:Putative E3 ubiquitin-protein ligase HERC1 n=1 Tax=Symbiodinium microadriaticum TaxID=2951 RepID=A0A1Q9EQA5_SYMMI|nr:putative E3 ubiquitin-protein ligase HERC1 [Symbiodinium microadriaticum]